MSKHAILGQLEDVLAQQMGCKDRTLAEYIYNLGKKGDHHLYKELSDFPAEFIQRIGSIIKNEINVGSVHTGIVTGVKPFGAFVNLNGRSGLLHRSQCSRDLKTGDTVKVSVIDIKDNRISLASVETPTIECEFERRQIQAAINGKRPPPVVINHDDEVSEEVEISISKRVPSFLQNQHEFDPSLARQSTAVVTNASEGWLGKAASFTGGKVSEASVNLRNEASSTPKPANYSESKKESKTQPNTFDKLPVHAYRSEIVQAVAGNSVVVIVGDTGSGKTTQITQFLHAGGYSANHKIIACTQPRRLAAISIAQRVAQEMGSARVGGLVGYSVRFDDCTSEHTEVKFMTDGILQREIISDPDLSKYAAIMLDEAHERTIATDVLFALLKSATARRPDLKVIVTSATLDAERFADYFGGAPVLRIPGRTFPVEIKWSPEPVLDYMEAAISTVKHIHDTTENGDILVFLTGQAEIDLAVSAITKTHPKGDLIPIPVYAAIPSELQSLIFNPAPPGKRKVVFATNIAETSLTIDGIYYVIDPGFAKIQVWDANKGMGVLQVQAISQAQANQRTGRAGRTAPGICYRLYTKHSYEVEMPVSTVPEIQRDNLGHTVLSLKAMGIKDIMNFDFIDPPSKTSMMHAMHELYLLGALDDNADITRLGNEMARYPLDPSLAKVLVTAKKYGPECMDDALTVISMLSMPNVFYRPSQPPAKQAEADRAHRQFQDLTGDHVTLLQVYNRWMQSGFNRKWCEKNYIQYKTMTKVRDARKQLSDLVLNKNSGHEKSTPDAYIHKDRKIQMLKCLCAGFFQNVAKSLGGRGGTYSTLTTNMQVSIHPSSSLFKKDVTYVLYSSLILTSKEYMHVVSEIKPEWLVSAVPGYYETSSADGGKKRRGDESLQPLYKKYATHENEWRVSEQRKTMFSKRTR